jgi:hypothetical protein
MKFRLLLLALALATVHVYAADTLYIKLHFLYGSKPVKEYRDIEPKWFGGKLGGHVGIEIDSNYIIDFVPEGKFHWFSHRKEFHSKFAVHTRASFWEIFGADSSHSKRTTVIIPITTQQKQKLDSLAEAYTSRTPYDYAFIGMRCAAAAYDVLAEIGVVKKYSRRGTYARNFYPKKLRKRIFRTARRNNWEIIRHEGSPTRKWEKD